MVKTPRSVSSGSPADHRTVRPRSQGDGEGTVYHGRRSVARTPHPGPPPHGGREANPFRRRVLLPPSPRVGEGRGGGRGREKRYNSDRPTSESWPIGPSIRSGPPVGRHGVGDRPSR